MAKTLKYYYWGILIILTIDFIIAIYYLLKMIDNSVYKIVMAFLSLIFLSNFLAKGMIKINKKNNKRVERDE